LKHVLEENLIKNLKRQEQDKDTHKEKLFFVDPLYRILERPIERKHLAQSKNISKAFTIASLV